MSLYVMATELILPELLSVPELLLYLDLYNERLSLGAVVVPETGV